MKLHYLILIFFIVRAAGGRTVNATSHHAKMSEKDRERLETELILLILVSGPPQAPLTPQH
jgi:hypothetical protein